MMEGEYSKELELAIEAVHRASKVTKDVMRGIDALDKTDNSPVTIADFAAQALLICAIKQTFPDDEFIAEESADMLREDRTTLARTFDLVRHANGDGWKLPLPTSEEDMMNYIDLGSKKVGPKSGRVWILDPIDGTATFMKSQQYAVCLCLVVGGEQKVAVVGCPNLPFGQSRVEELLPDMEHYGLIAYAVAGKGAYQARLEKDSIGTATPLKRPTDRTVLDQLLVIDSIKSSHADIPTHRKVYESLGIISKSGDLWSQQMKYIALALGSYDVMIRLPPKLSYRACVWDHAGGQLIYEESGGVITDMYGKRFKFGGDREFVDNCGYIAADKELHGSLVVAAQTALQDRKNDDSHPPVDYQSL